MVQDDAPALLTCEAFAVSTSGDWQSRALSFSLASGEVHCLVGRPGSGKSLILERLCGVSRPGIRAQGKAVSGSTVLVPQDARLSVLPTDQVWALLGLSGLRVRMMQWFGVRLETKAEENRTRDLMKKLRLDPERIAELPFLDLSATERRSVLLVAALLAEPGVLALDGWDEMMDGPNRRAIAAVLRERMAGGMGLLFSSRRFPLRDFEGAIPHSLGEGESSVDHAVPLIARQTGSPPHSHALLELNRMGVQKRRLGIFRGRPPAYPVDGASLFVRHGESLVLFGAAGSGKTTLLEAVAGLEPISRGTVRVEGHDVTRARGNRGRRLRRDVQLVFQDATSILDGRRTVEAHLEEAMSLGQNRDGSASEWLERLGLSPRLLKARADQLSAAESQRVDLARSLVVAPRLVLFDSPEVAAAGTDGGLIAALLTTEKARGRSFLVATSDPELAWSLADRVAVLHAGRVVELGTKHEVLGRAAHPITRALLDGTPLSPSDPTAPSVGCPHARLCQRRQLPQCDEHEPMLAQFRGRDSFNDVPISGERRVACFHPIES